MFQSTRGRAVIINNEYFVQASVRDGCANDVRDLKKLFHALHFNVVLHENKTAQVSSQMK